MERSKYFVIVFLMLLSFLDVRATYKSDIYNAYISNNMDKWKTTIDAMNRQQNRSNEFVLELLNYQYGYIGWCIGNKKNKLAEEFIELGQKSIQMLEKNNYKISMVNSYKSAFYGFRIGLNKLQAPFIGPKSVECSKLAMKQDDKNPYGYIQFGNSEYYMPAMFGGSKKVALEYYEKALKLMEANSAQAKEDWNYLSLLTIIAEAYTELENYKSAKSIYEKILKIEPNFLWVKNGLYPSLLKKIKQQQ
jgi:tetratricopeptide (TPR) repeat protein